MHFRCIYIYIYAYTFNINTSLLQVLAETEEAQICILRNMYALWKNHYQMMVVLTDKFLKTGIIECSAIANWIFSKEMASEFTKFVLLLYSIKYLFIYLTSKYQHNSWYKKYHNNIRNFHFQIIYLGNTAFDNT